MGSGQFCTNPGLVIAVDGPGLDDFIASARDALTQAAATPMLTPTIAANYANGVDTLSAKADLVARGAAADRPTACQAALFATDAANFQDSEVLQAEVFGASSMVVRCGDAAEMSSVAAGLDEAARLLPTLETKAGRILFNGWPTGVEVGYAMVHGGPYPATSDSRTTSVGARAIERFLRPVCYQDVPKSLLPSAIADGNPDGLLRRIDGRLVQD
jgi:NADP-dependent aldehyde dehydrogenase